MIWATRSALSATLGDEVRRRFAGSAFGVFWVFLVPLLFLGLYSAVYLWIFKVKPADITAIDYVLFVYIGLAAYLSFVDALSSGTGSWQANRSILLNTVFPAEMLTLRSVLSTQTTFVIGLTICLVWSAIAGRLTSAAVWVPYLAVSQIAFLVGLSWFLAPIYIVFKDLGQIINFAVLLMLVISPIAYRASELRDVAAALAHGNPLFYFLIGYQSAIFDGTEPPTDTLVIAGVLGVVFFCAGFAFCQRVKMPVADHV